jgi:hypothetical protein
MGKGKQVKVIGGADPFDPFRAFEKIEFLKAPGLNKWTASHSGSAGVGRGQTVQPGVRTRSTSG